MSILSLASVWRGPAPWARPHPEAERDMISPWQALYPVFICFITGKPVPPTSNIICKIGLAVCILHVRVSHHICKGRRC